MSELHRPVVTHSGLNCATEWNQSHSPNISESERRLREQTDSAPLAASWLALGEFLKESNRLEDSIHAFDRAWELAKLEKSPRCRMKACVQLAISHQECGDLVMTEQYRQLAVTAYCQCDLNEDYPDELLLLNAFQWLREQKFVLAKSTFEQLSTRTSEPCARSVAESFLLLIAEEFINGVLPPLLQHQMQLVITRNFRWPLEAQRQFLNLLNERIVRTLQHEEWTEGVALLSMAQQISHHWNQPIQGDWYRSAESRLKRALHLMRQEAEWN